MTETEKKYLELENKLVNGRISKTISAEEDDAILAEMGELWWKLTADETRRADKRIMDYMEKKRQQLMRNGTYNCICANLLIQRMEHLNGFILAVSARANKNLYKNPPFKFCPWCGGLYPQEKRDDNRH